MKEIDVRTFDKIFSSYLWNIKKETSSLFIWSIERTHSVNFQKNKTDIEKTRTFHW